ncbi:MAG: low molecular weight phosphotyrosine protein phosphatase [Luteolibacter sp.]
MTRVLFICMGNICRSPAAEIVFRKMVKDAGREDEFEIDSAGTIGFHKGNPPDLRMTDHLAKRGYEVEGKSRQLVVGDLSEFDLLLTMDEENLADTLGLDSSGELHHKVKSFVDFLRENEAPRIPDPYYGGDSGFVQVIDLLEDGCAALLESLPAAQD